MPQQYDCVVMMLIGESGQVTESYHTKRKLTVNCEHSLFSPQLFVYKNVEHNYDYYERIIPSCQTLRQAIQTPLPELRLLTPRSKLMIVGHGSTGSQHISGGGNCYPLSEIAQVIASGLNLAIQFSEKAPLHITLFSCEGGAANTLNYPKDSMAGQLLHALKAQGVITEIRAHTSSTGFREKPYLPNNHHYQWMRGFTLSPKQQSLKTIPTIRPLLLSEPAYGKRVTYCWKDGIAKVYENNDYKTGTYQDFDTFVDRQKEAIAEIILDKAAALQGSKSHVQNKLIGLVQMVSALEKAKNTQEMINILQTALDNPQSAVNQHTNSVFFKRVGRTKTSIIVRDLIALLQNNTPIAQVHMDSSES